MEVGDIFKFEKFLSIPLIKILYVVVGVLIALGTLIGVIQGQGPLGGLFGHSSWSLSGALMSLLMGVIGLVVWRVLCEGMIVVFSINDRLGALVELKKSEMGK